MLRWNFQTDPLCVLCHNGLESKSHLLVQCAFSCFIWEPLAKKRSFASPRDWKDLLHSTRAAAGPKPYKKLLRLSYQTTIYLVWKEMNNQIHRQVFISLASILQESNLLIKNRISSLRDMLSVLTFSMMQLWMSSWSSTIDIIIIIILSVPDSGSLIISLPICLALPLLCGDSVANN